MKRKALCFIVILVICLFSVTYSIEAGAETHKMTSITHRGVFYDSKGNNTKRDQFFSVIIQNNPSDNPREHVGYPIGYYTKTTALLELFLPPDVGYSAIEVSNCSTLTVQLFSHDFAVGSFYCIVNQQGLIDIRIYSEDGLIYQASFYVD